MIVIGRAVRVIYKFAYKRCRWEYAKSKYTLTDTNKSVPSHNYLAKSKDN